jgi:DNA invertase Pin-like site-specific DNA recombinase
MPERNGKPLRFAALIRVSTEKQEKQGESLATQRDELPKNVQHLGGTITAWYGGQEHATPGYEKGEVDRMIADAGKEKFDAVIVLYADRWSRDNAKSKQGLAAFRKHGIRFFVGSTEMDLFDPQHQLFLGMNAEIGEFFAAQQAKKAIEARIHRAERGLPTCGKLPFGRIFIRDGRDGRWEVDSAKQALVQDVARRYLEGEKMPDLARKYGMDHSNLHKILTKRCGDTWEQVFFSRNLNIRKKVLTPVPALLPPETIEAIHKRAVANRTWLHGQRKNRYLLGRMVFCSHCGYSMSAQCNPDGTRYYRHHHCRRVHDCNRKNMFVNANALEEAVFFELFTCFGNPAAVQRAIDASIPNRQKIEEFQERQQRVIKELEKTRAARDRLLKLVIQGAVATQQAQKHLDELDAREGDLLAELGRLADSLSQLPDPAEVKVFAEKVSKRFHRSARLWAIKEDVNSDREGMTWEDNTGGNGVWR